MQKMEDALTRDVFEAHILSIPPKVFLISACSGSGSFELAALALFDQIAASQQEIDATAPDFTLINYSSRGI